MNKDIVEGHWTEIKGKLKAKWGKFTDDDITAMSGTRDELAGRLQKIYGYEKDKAYGEIDTFLDEQKFEDKTSVD